MDKSTLKPCPFCGGEAEHLRLVKIPEGGGNLVFHGHRIRCIWCKVQTKRTDFAAGAYSDWNKRP